MFAIRKEIPGDINAICELQYQAFKDHPRHKPGAEPTEHLIVDGLRRAEALSLSLVSAPHGTLRGHIAFSPAHIDGQDQGLYSLGPVGVSPSYQNQGIGTALIHQGLDEMRKMDARGIILVGDPAFYDRFGFTPNPTLTMEGVPAQYVLSLRLAAPMPKGAVAIHPAFFAQAG